MIVFIAMDGDDFLGYTTGDGQIYADLDDVPVKRSLFGKPSSISIAADIIYIQGRGLVNKAAEYQARIESAKRAADIEYLMNRPKSGEVLHKGRK